MDMPKLDRDLGRRIEGAGRCAPHFTRAELERELGRVEEIERARSSSSTASPEIEKQELPRLGME